MPAKGDDVRSARAHDRHVRLGRGRGHPGRPEGVRGRGLPRHERRSSRSRRRARPRSRPSTSCRRSSSRAELDAVFGDIGVDAAKTGMLFSRRLIETVADYLEEHPVPLVVDPVMVASSGAKLLEDDAVDTLVGRLFPLATVVTPNLPEAQALTGLDVEDRRALSERLVELGAPSRPRHRRPRRAPDRPPLRRHRPRRDPGPLRRRSPHARRRLHALGHARGAARARREPARGRGRRLDGRVLRRRARAARARRRRRAPSTCST